MAKMKILSVDDNLQNLKLIQLALEEQFEVRSSEGNEPIEQLLEQFKPDVVLLDIMLGQIDGYDMCRTIRECQLCPDVVVIFVSSLSSLEDKMAAYGAGGDDYICKPIDLQEFEQKLISLQKRLEQQKNLEAQYESASQVAFSSMQQSSELGQLIGFFTETLEISDLPNLYQAIVQFVKCFGSHCVAEFRLGGQNYQFPQQGVGALESEILELGRNAKRIVSFGQNLLLNSAWCSLLIKKMPQDEELVGRLRDHYAIMLGIADTRIMLLESRLSQKNERTKAIKQVGDAVNNGLGRLKDELREHELQAQSIVQQLESSMNIGLVSLGLSEEQESALMAMVEDTRERFENMAGLSMKIDKEIAQIDKLLGRIA